MAGERRRPPEVLTLRRPPALQKVWLRLLPVQKPALQAAHWVPARWSWAARQMYQAVRRVGLRVRQAVEVAEEQTAVGPVPALPGPQARGLLLRRPALRSPLRPLPVRVAPVVAPSRSKLGTR